MGDARESDLALAEGIARGDMDALGALYDRHAPTLFALARRILHDDAAAQDVVHDTFVCAWERARFYAPEKGTIAAWLVTMARNLAIDRLRRRDRRAEILRTAADQLEPTARPPHADAATDESAVASALHTALADLGDPQRSTLERAFFEGMTYEEIAAADHVPLGTVKSRAARGMATLRAALARAGLSLDELL